jgi:hypothetical protein
MCLGLSRGYAGQILDGVLNIGTRPIDGTALQVVKRLANVNKSGFDAGHAEHPNTAELIALPHETLRHQFLFANVEFLNELPGWNLIAGSPMQPGGCRRQTRFQ